MNILWKLYDSGAILGVIVVWGYIIAAYIDSVV